MFLSLEDFAGIAFVGMLISIPFVLLGAMPVAVLIAFIAVIFFALKCHEG